jgi:hypothetical protein
MAATQSDWLADPERGNLFMEIRKAERRQEVIANRLFYLYSLIKSNQSAIILCGVIRSW